MTGRGRRPYPLGNKSSMNCCVILGSHCMHTQRTFCWWKTSALCRWYTVLTHVRRRKNWKRWLKRRFTRLWMEDFLSGYQFTGHGTMAQVVGGTKTHVSSRWWFYTVLCDSFRFRFKPISCMEIHLDLYDIGLYTKYMKWSVVGTYV